MARKVCTIMGAHSRIGKETAGKLADMGQLSSWFAEEEDYGHFNPANPIVFGLLTSLILLDH
jgi:hypothetical protein